MIQLNDSNDYQEYAEDYNSLANMQNEPLMTSNLLPNPLPQQKLSTPGICFGGNFIQNKYNLPLRKRS